MGLRKDLSGLSETGPENFCADDFGKLLRDSSTGWGDLSDAPALGAEYKLSRECSNTSPVRLQGGDDHLAEDIDNLRCVRVSVREISAHLPGAQKPALDGQGQGQ
eukprot:Tamp_25931.p2 GENE.Tamp_25931~~Tamp_25931.p2  ORF type:complete len:105 (+),score=13.20 Tamp_25931:158-472(+)